MIVLPGSFLVVIYCGYCKPELNYRRGAFSFHLTCGERTPMNSDQSSDKQPRTISNESSLAALPLRVSERKLEDAMDEDKIDFKTPAIELRNVDFSYDVNKVLNGVNFQVA